MDSEVLALSSDLMATASGFCLTTEQRALLPPSLEILKIENKFSRVIFWGKLQGKMGDYVIAQGLGEAATLDSKVEGGDIVVAEYFETLKAIPKKTYRLSPDGVAWTLLPTVDDEVKGKVAEFDTFVRAAGKVFEPLMGDSAHVFKYTVSVPPAEEGGEATTEEKELAEDERLAAMVAEIDEATSVVPVGSYVLTAAQRVQANNFYKGLPLSDGLSIRSYIHLRSPHGSSEETGPINQSAMVKARDFLDSVAGDTPKGSWSLKHDSPNNMIVLRSLLYPGYIHFNMVDSPLFGSAYVGTGLKNFNLAFML
mmetsp:Transcript_4607/g.9075  ORF Transcript_4607/g.9075 Transcript_4607/m.9075 type:complete len:310 (-) Transcript_4607:346-1275(-)